MAGTTKLMQQFQRMLKNNAARCQPAVMKGVILMEKGKPRKKVEGRSRRNNMVGGNARRAKLQAVEDVPERFCNRCNAKFKPISRFNFTCNGCHNKPLDVGSIREFSTVRIRKTKGASYDI